MRARATGGAGVDSVVKGGLSEKVTFEQRLIWKEGVSHVHIWGKGFLVRGNS